MPVRPSKGKARASANTETTPLIDTSPGLEHYDKARQHLRRPPILFAVCTITVSIVLASALFLTLLLSSFKPAASELQALPRTAVLYQAPESVTVINVTDQGILLNVTLRCGIDADRALGIQRLSASETSAAAAKGERGGSSAWWEHVRQWTANRILGGLPARAVHVQIPNDVLIGQPQSVPDRLATVTILDRLVIPLVSDVPSDLPPKWLPLMTFKAVVKPVASSGDILRFVQDSWISGHAEIELQIDRAEASLPHGPWWTKLAKTDRDDIRLNMLVPVPHLPGLPDPGSPLNLSSLVTLRHYSFETQSSPQALTISASATLPNFAPQVNLTIPFSLPFSISLPTKASESDNRMALVITEPVNVTSINEVIELKMSGIITANFTSPENETSALSVFIREFLHGKDNDIIVKGLATLPDFAHSAPPPPGWLLSSLPSLSLPLVFPGPHPRPKVIQSVTIEHMRISESAGKMKASGIVVAEVELPHEMRSIVVDVIEVLPDVLVFDGLAPDDDGDDQDDPPPRAFGHINPEDFLTATTSPSGDPQYPHRLVVTAPLSEVDLNVLPGRDSVLSDFVTKVIFKGGAQAGIKGTASVVAMIPGVKGKIRLDDLPVTGDFWVGKQKRVAAL